MIQPRFDSAGLRRSEFRAFALMVACTLLVSTAAPGSARGAMGSPGTDWISGPVSVLATPAEKEAFARLDSESARSQFIEAFWKQRDPRPETDVNEFKTAFEERLEYATRFLRRGWREPAWKTDLGRAYLLLGEPAGIREFGAKAGLVTCELWDYKALGRDCMPSDISLVFYKEGKNEPFRVFNSCFEGPEVLLAGKSKAGNRSAAAAALEKVDTDLANAVLRPDSCEGPQGLGNLVAFLKQEQPAPCYPGGGPAKPALAGAKGQAPGSAKAATAVGQPPRAAQVIREPDETGGVKRMVRAGGLRGFVVEHDTSAGRDMEYMLQADPGFPELGGFAEEQSSTLITRMTFSGVQPPNNVAEETTTISLKRSAAQIVREREFALLGHVAVPENARGVEIQLEQKETGRRLHFEAALPGGVPERAELWLGYMDAASRAHGAMERPFSSLGTGVFPNLTELYGLKEQLLLHMRLNAASYRTGIQPELAFLQDGAEVKRVFCGEIPAGRNHDGVVSVTRPVSLTGLEPGLYTVRVEGLAGTDRGPEVLIRILEQDYADRPWIVFKEREAALTSSVDKALSTIRTGDLDSGMGQLEELIKSDPENAKARIIQGEALFLKGRYREIFSVVQPALSDPAYAPRATMLIGMAYSALGRFEDSAEWLRKSIDAGLATPEVLNALGEVYSHIGRAEEALEAFRRSFEMDPKQDWIKEEIDKLEKSP